MRADQPARAGGEENASSPAAWTSSGRDADVIRVRCRPRRRVTRHASGVSLHCAAVAGAGGREGRAGPFSSASLVRGRVVPEGTDREHGHRGHGGGRESDEGAAPESSLRTLSSNCSVSVTREIASPKAPGLPVSSHQHGYGRNPAHGRVRLPRSKERNSVCEDAVFINIS